MNSTTSEGYGLLPFWFSCYVLFGIVFGGSSFLIAAIILRYRALRSAKQFVLVAGLSLSDGFNMLGTGIAGAYRLSRMVRGKYNMNITPWECFFLPHTLMWCWTELLAGIMLCVISLDRLLAMGRPLMYFKFRQRYAMCMVAWPFCLSWCFGITVGVFAYLADQEPVVSAMCGLGQLTQKSAPEFIFMVHEQGGSIFPGISVLLYIVVWWLYKRHSARVTSQQPESEQQRQEQRQRQMTITLGISTLCTLLVVVIPMYIGHQMYFAGHTNVGFFCFVVTYLNPFCNFFIYAWRHAEIRKGLDALFKGKHMPEALDLWTSDTASKASQRSKRAVRKT